MTHAVRHIAAKRPRILITIEGGLIQDALADADCEILIIDYDTEGVDEADLTPVPQGDGKTIDAIIQRGSVDINAQEVNRCYESIPAQDMAELAGLNNLKGAP